MKYTITIIAFVTIFSAFLRAESPYQRDLNELQVGRDKAVSAAVEPINLRYQASLEQLIRKATQANDLDAANQIKLALANITPAFGGGVATHSLLGKWVFRAGAWSDNRELKADGWVVCTLDGLAKWAVNGTELKIDFPNGNWAVFTLPVRNGKLVGKGSQGEQMTAEKVAIP
ncbi:MAG: hypothetical protein ACAI34_25400 [Verrucomicrobium sp.]|nr:hypothetical protein [Verrucomicrobium sp.]